VLQAGVALGRAFKPSSPERCTRGCHCGRQDRRVTPVGLGSVPLCGSGGGVFAAAGAEEREKLQASDAIADCWLTLTAGSFLAGSGIAPYHRALRRSQSGRGQRLPQDRGAQRRTTAGRPSGCGPLATRRTVPRICRTVHFSAVGLRTMAMTIPATTAKANRRIQTIRMIDPRCIVPIFVT